MAIAAASVAVAATRGSAARGAGRAGADPRRLGAGAGPAGTRSSPSWPSAIPRSFPTNGKTYDFEPMRFPAARRRSRPWRSGSSRSRRSRDSAFALAVTNAHLDVQIVADVLQAGRPGYYAGQYVVAKDGPIKTIEDIKGKRVATNAIGSEADTTMRTMLRKHGIQDTDFTTIEANFANMLAMIEGGKVDMIPLLPQFCREFEATGKYRMLFTADEVHGVGATRCSGRMRADFIAAHRPALVDFFADHMRAMHWFLDPKNHAEALAIAAAVTQKPRRDLEYVFTEDDFYRSPDLMPMIAAIQKEIDEDVEARRPAEGDRRSTRTMSICR